MPALNAASIIARVQAAEEIALAEVGAFVAADAKARAPIRKVFKERRGFRRKFRPLTSEERTRAIRRALAYQGYNDFQRRRSVAYLKSYARAEVPRRGSMNSLKNSRRLRILGIQSPKGFKSRIDARKVGRGYESETLNPLLTSRGRYEARSGRAIHREVLASGNVRIHIGGALKASIGAEDVVQSGQETTVKVTAAIRYAKFVEFPTTHNAAQPFLLPALHDSRTRLRQTLAREVRKAFGG